MPKRSNPNNAGGSKGSKCSKVVSKTKQGGPKSKRNRPSQYRQHDQGTAFIRSHLIRGLANQLIGHRRENGGKTQRGFLKGLLDSANDANSLLEITRNDINNEVSRIIAASTMEEVSAASLTEGTNDIDSELISIAASSNSGQTVQVAPHIAQRVTASRKEASLDTPIGADALHVLAAVALERSPSRALAKTNVARSSASSSIVQTLPNRCHFAECGAPSDLIPTVCGNQNCRRTLRRNSTSKTNSMSLVNCPKPHQS